jgi:hypothetical protein
VGKRSSEIEIFMVSRDGEQKKKDEVVREEEVVVRIDKEVHKKGGTKHENRKPMQQL